MAAEYELSRNIEHYLATLSKLYGRNGDREKQAIIVNSQARVHEDWSDHGWGEACGHALYLKMPESLYFNAVKERDMLQAAIRDDLNSLHDVRGEHIEAVFFEMEDIEDQDWRSESGLLLQPQQRVIPPNAEERVWDVKGAYRVFLSHKADVKKETAELKEQLEVFGISSFVAHTDIHPTKEWQDEIENALASMDAFVALLTDNFHDSDWTDQEVGYALARGVPIIAVKLGRDPYGFIGKFQALKRNWDDAPAAIVKLLLEHPRMRACYLNRVPKCDSFDQGNKLAEVFPYLKKLTEGEAARLRLAFNGNMQLQGSYGFSGSRPNKFGPGLAHYLTKLTGIEHVRNGNEIKIVK